MSKSLRKVISSLTALAMGLNFLLVQIPTASAEYTLLGKSLKSTWKLNSGEEDASDLSAKSELAFSSSSDIYSVTMKNTESDGGSDASISVTLSENEDDSVFVLTGGGETVEVSKDNGVATYSVGVKNTDLTPLTKYYSANLVIKDKNGSDAHTVALVYGNPLAYSGEIATEAGTGSVTLSAPGKPVSINVTNSTAIEQKIKVTVDEGTNKTGISADGTNVSESISGLFKITSDSDEVLSEDTLTVSSDGSSFKVSLDGSKVGKNGTYLGTINVDSENDAYDFSFTVKAVVEYRAMDIAGLANNLTAFLPASGNRTQFNYGGNNTEKLYGFDGYVPLANGFSVYGDFTSGTVYDNWISVDANSDGTNMPNINTQGGGNANRRNIKIDGLLDGDQIVVVGGSGSVTHSLGTTAGGEELVTKANGGLGTTGATKALVTYNVNQNADSVYFTTAGSVRIYEVYVLSGTVYTDNKGNLTSITQFTKDIGAAKAVTSQKIADTSGTTGVIAAGVTKTGNGQFTFNSAEDARGLIDLTGVLTHSGNTKTRVIYSVSSAGDTGATFTGWSRTAGGGTLTEKGEINPNAFLVTSAGTATIKGTVVNSGTNYANYSEEFDITILAATVPEADVKVTADQGWTNSDGETKAKIELSGKEGAIEAFSTVSVTNS
ncbi:MAG: hypothetical protein LBR74_09365, partial [Eubacterium sp.]|nr:hypothetical protein [Eubacterium sp.]